MPARRILPLLLALLLAGSPEGAAGAGGGSNGNGTCPLDLSYVPSFPWDPTPCAGSAPNITACRQTLLSLLGIGLAGRLRATGQFRLPSAGAAAACLAGLADGISAPPASLPGASLVRSCFPSPGDFVSTPSYCAGVTTAAEYRAVVGNDSVAGLDAACGPELASLPVCYRCLTAGIVATSHLIAAVANATAESQRNCFYLTVIYAAGISSVDGPTALSSLHRQLHARARPIHPTLPPFQVKQHNHLRHHHSNRHHPAPISYRILPLEKKKARQHQQKQRPQHP